MATTIRDTMALRLDLPRGLPEEFNRRTSFYVQAARFPAALLWLMESDEKTILDAMEQFECWKLTKRDNGEYESLAIWQYTLDIPVPLARAFCKWTNCTLDVRSLYAAAAITGLITGPEVTMTGHQQAVGTARPNGLSNTPNEFAPRFTIAIAVDRLEQWLDTIAYRDSLGRLFGQAGESCPLIDLNQRPTFEPSALDRGLDVSRSSSIDHEEQLRWCQLRAEAVERRTGRRAY